MAIAWINGEYVEIETPVLPKPAQSTDTRLRALIKGLSEATTLAQIRSIAGDILQATEETQSAQA